MTVREVKSKDHPPDFKHIEVLVRFWSQKDSPSYVTFFLKKGNNMTSDRIRTLAVKKTRQFLSKIEYIQ